MNTERVAFLKAVIKNYEEALPKAERPDRIRECIMHLKNELVEEINKDR